MNFDPLELYLQAEILYKNGSSCSQIEKALGLNRKKVSLYLKTQGHTIKVIAGNHNSANIQEDFLKAKELFLKGWSLRSIATELNLSRGSLSYRLKKEGYIIIPSRPRRKKEILELEAKLRIGEEHFQKSGAISVAASYAQVGQYELRKHLESKGYDITPYRKYSVNDTIFKTIDNEEKAYWLGFLYADGYVDTFKNVLEVVLKSEDLLHLEKLKNFLGSTQEIKLKEIRLQNQVYKAFRLSIYNKNIVLDLIALGCVENKSLIIEFPNYNIVPKNLMRHFIRGYFDGDGSISLSKRRNNKEVTLGFISTEAFLEGLRKEIVLPKRKLSAEGNAFSLRYSGVILPSKILSYMYENATIFLERKYNTYSQFLKNRNPIFDP